MRKTQNPALGSDKERAIPAEVCWEQTVLQSTGSTEVRKERPLRAATAEMSCSRGKETALATAESVGNGLDSKGSSTIRSDN